MFCKRKKKKSFRQRWGNFTATQTPAPLAGRLRQDGQEPGREGGSAGAWSSETEGFPGVPASSRGSRPLPPRMLPAARDRACVRLSPGPHIAHTLTRRCACDTAQWQGRRKREDKPTSPAPPTHACDSTMAGQKKEKGKLIQFSLSPPPKHTHTDMPVPRTRAHTHNVPVTNRCACDTRAHTHTHRCACDTAQWQCRKEKSKAKSSSSPRNSPSLLSSQTCPA